MKNIIYSSKKRLRNSLETSLTMCTLKEWFKMHEYRSDHLNFNPIKAK